MRQIMTGVQTSPGRNCTHWQRKQLYWEEDEKTVGLPKIAMHRTTDNRQRDGEHNE
jgi:hypothetical protein